MEDLGVGFSLLEHVILTCREACNVSDIILAIPNNTLDSVLSLVNKYGLKVVVGAEENVLSRFVKAIHSHKIKDYVRVCADSPLLCPLFIDELIDFHLEGKNDLTTAGNVAKGLVPEVASATGTIRAKLSGTCPCHNEHVTGWLKSSGAGKRGFKFRVKYFNVLNGVDLSIDTADDLARVKRIIKKVWNGSPPTAYELHELYKSQPELFHG